MRDVESKGFTIGKIGDVGVVEKVA